MPFNKELKGELSAGSHHAWITGSVYAHIPASDSSAYPVPYAGMDVVSLNRRGSPRAYALFGSESEINRFPALRKAISDHRLRVQLHGCAHTLDISGGRRTTGRGTLPYTVPTKGRSRILLFDVTDVGVIG
jgi:hypothetical protein